MQGQTNKPLLQARLQRRLRHQSTDAERALWQHLRGRQLDGCKFRRQHPFGDYILDFACLERKLVIELDGGQHADATAAAKDERRTAFLKAAGFVVLRYWNHQVFGELDAVLDDVWRALRLRLRDSAQPIPPCPPLEGEGSNAESCRALSPPLLGEGWVGMVFSHHAAINSPGSVFAKADPA